MCAFHQYLSLTIKLNIKNIFQFFYYYFVLFVTLKYHFRFNDERRFHEMSKINFDLSIDAKKLTKNFLV